jgi:Mor family transcriptional regulator
MKNFRSIFIKEKILIACQVIVGEKIQPLAKKYKVSRPSIYLWRKRALEKLFFLMPTILKDKEELIQH